MAAACVCSRRPARAAKTKVNVREMFEHLSRATVSYMDTKPAAAGAPKNKSCTIL